MIIVMERPPGTVDGHDYLFQVKYIPEDQVKVIFKQIINAALLMHKNGVFHRDLKLDNILVDRSKGTPEIRVIDFKCGDFVENEPFSYFDGTPEYAPPEVYRWETYKAEATTVWQIGLLTTWRTLRVLRRLISLLFVVMHRENKRLEQRTSKHCTQCALVWI
uniref:Serine/threonine-protein kinase 1 n=1 Tax=Gouania willdenowi TaxID=441366 RepID=A0A8C5G5C2_GOUWI